MDTSNEDDARLLLQNGNYSLSGSKSTACLQISIFNAGTVSIAAECHPNPRLVLPCVASMDSIEHVNDMYEPAVEWIRGSYMTLAICASFLLGIHATASYKLQPGQFRHFKYQHVAAGP